MSFSYVGLESRMHSAVLLPIRLPRTIVGETNGEPTPGFPLSIDLVVRILRLCESQQDLFRCSLVCKTWLRAAARTEVWNESSWAHDLHARMNGNAVTAVDGFLLPPSKLQNSSRRGGDDDDQEDRPSKYLSHLPPLEATLTPPFPPSLFAVDDGT
jgi:F-box-like